MHDIPLATCNHTSLGASCEQKYAPVTGEGGWEQSTDRPLGREVDVPPRAPPRRRPATATGVVPQLLYAGAHVKGRYLASSIGTPSKFGTKWWPATVRHVHPDGTCDLVYEDGDLEDSVRPEFVRPFPSL